MKRVVLVNGVPASGKSTVARAVSEAKGWPLLTLDTIKEAFFEHIGTGDRNYNRLMGSTDVRVNARQAGPAPRGIANANGDDGRARRVRAGFVARLRLCAARS